LLSLFGFYLVRGTLVRDFETRVYKNSGHNERSWARYLDQPMKFWLETK